MPSELPLSDRARRAAATAALLSLLSTAGTLGPTDPAYADDDAFEVRAIASPGRTLAAELVDLNGDGLDDLLEIAALGTPPDESRQIRVFFTSAGRGLTARPAFVTALPGRAATYDLADVGGEPGTELLLLTASSVLVWSLRAPDAPRDELPVPGATTLGPRADERGIERLHLGWPDASAVRWLWVPQMGETTALSTAGEVLARLRVGGRANYFAPVRGSLIASESDLQLYYDGPRMAMGDVDGDGRADVVFATRHAIQVHLQRPNGSFVPDPDRRLQPALVSARDHVRGSGGVVTQARDVDGDGLLDLLLTHVEGSFANASTSTRYYRNREGQWSLAAPDSLIASPGRLGSDALLDLDGDGKLELLRAQLDFSVLEVVEALLTQEIDVVVNVHRLNERGVFDEDPWRKRKVSVPLSFDTFRPKGFVPTLAFDLNGDGRRDMLDSDGGKAIEVYLGDASGLSGREAHQKLDTGGLLRAGDLDADGLPDFVIFDPQREDASLRVVRNLGVLPGSPPRLEPATGRRKP